MTIDSTEELFAGVSQAGYYPDIVAGALNDAIAGEPVHAHVIHHEPTFDRSEIRRHMSVLVLTPTRVILTHTDEHPGDTLLPQAYTTTSSESVSLSRIAAVVVTRLVSTESHALQEVVLTVTWGAVSRIDLEPARCDDPECEADHGYTGAVSGDDFSLRISAAAEGGSAVENLLTFGKLLNEATIKPGAMSS